MESDTKHIKEWRHLRDVHKNSPLYIHLLVVARIGLLYEKGHRKTFSVDHYPLFIADIHSETDLTTVNRPVWPVLCLERQR